MFKEGWKIPELTVLHVYSLCCVGTSASRGRVVPLKWVRKQISIVRIGISSLRPRLTRQSLLNWRAAMSVLPLRLAETRSSVMMTHFQVQNAKSFRISQSCLVLAAWLLRRITRPPMSYFIIYAGALLPPRDTIMHTSTCSAPSCKILFWCSNSCWRYFRSHVLDCLSTACPGKDLPLALYYSSANCAFPGSLFEGWLADWLVICRYLLMWRAVPRILLELQLHCYNKIISTTTTICRGYCAQYGKIRYLREVQVWKFNPRAEILQ